MTVTLTEPATAPVTTRDVLHRAADLLEEWGWRQMHVGSKSQGAFCALGAINEALRDYGDYVAGNPLRREAERKVRELLGGESVAHWNDAPGRTKAEVVARLREAAEKAA